MATMNKSLLVACLFILVGIFSLGCLSSETNEDEVTHYQYTYSLNIRNNGNDHYKVILPFPIYGGGSPCRISEFVDWPQDLEFMFINVSEYESFNGTPNSYTGLKIESEKDLELSGEITDWSIPNFKMISLMSTRLDYNLTPKYESDHFKTTMPSYSIWIFSSSSNISVSFSIYTEVVRKNSGTSADRFVGNSKHLIPLEMGWQEIEMYQGVSEFQS